jgi:dTDP-L-rhamnose 4-epimerase
MKTLILGGAGFIGANTARRLQAAGHEVVIVDSFDPQIHGPDPKLSPTARELWGHFDIRIADAAEAVALNETWAGVDSVLYLASSTGTGQSMYDVQSYCRNNVMVGAVLAEQLLQRREQIKRLVVSSTRAVYGEGAWSCAQHGRTLAANRDVTRMQRGDFEARCPICDGPMMPAASKEEDATAPWSIYGITKLAQEQLMLNTAAAVGIPAIAFRYQNVYGPGQALRNPYTGILSIFTQLIRKDGELNIFEDGLATRDFVFIDDVAEYNVRALNSGLKGTTVINLGTGERQSILDVVRTLGQALGREPRYKVSGQFRVGDIRHAAADITRLRATLGAREFTSFAAGVQQLVDWALRTPLDGEAEQRYRHSLQHMSAAGLFLGRKAEGQR